MQPRFAGFADKKELMKRHGHDLANLRAGVGFALVKRSQCNRKVRLRELALVAHATVRQSHDSYHSRPRGLLAGVAMGPMTRSSSP